MKRRAIEEGEEEEEEEEEGEEGEGGEGKEEGEEEGERSEEMALAVNEARSSRMKLPFASIFSVKNALLEKNPEVLRQFPK